MGFLFNFTKVDINIFLVFLFFIFIKSCKNKLTEFDQKTLAMINGEFVGGMLGGGGGGGAHWF